MNSQYNIVIQWSGDKVWLELSCRWSICQILFLKFLVPLVAGFIHCQRFQFKSKSRLALGFIYITTGLLKPQTMKLSWQVFHEIGHIARRHLQYLLWR